MMAGPATGTPWIITVTAQTASDGAGDGWCSSWRSTLIQTCGNPSPLVAP
jgi:hypothetical protein